MHAPATSSPFRTWLFDSGADVAAHDAMAASGAQVLIQDLEDFTPRERRAEAPALLASPRMLPGADDLEVPTYLNAKRLLLSAVG